MLHTHHKLAGLGLLCALLVVASTAVAQPSGKVTMHATSVAVGVGAQWGQGTLTLYNGKQYLFTVQGLEIGSVGVSEVNAAGEVYNLQNLSDFNGVYAVAEANVAVGSVAGARTMRNERGVVIALSSVQQGVKLTLAGEGVRIALKE